MKFVKVCIAAVCLSAALAAPGCSAIQEITMSETADEKALFVAESSYAGMLALVEQGIETGLINASNTDAVAAAVGKAKAVLDAMRNAQAVGDALQVVQKAKELEKAIGEVGLAIGSTPTPS